MKQIIHLETITDLNNLLSQDKPKHPLVSVIDFSKVNGYGEEEMSLTSGFYSVMFKNHCHNKMKYGREYYDFQEGTLICIAPRQVVTIEAEKDVQGDVKGWGLFFHPDLLRGTSLGARMKEYTFFAYETNEALHLSDKEKQNLDSCIQKIEAELDENIDKHSQSLMVSSIELFLNYCARYYDRQFITRKKANQDILTRFEAVLANYFTTTDLQGKGLPTVKYCAAQLYLSPNYLGDLLKRETGMNAQDHIHNYIIEDAKHRLLSSNASVSEIAYHLGFEYPQYFSKLFKAKTGVTPNAYRQASNA